MIKRVPEFSEEEFEQIDSAITQNINKTKKKKEIQLEKLRLSKIDHKLNLDVNNIPLLR